MKVIFFYICIGLSLLFACKGQNKKKSQEALSIIELSANQYDTLYNKISSKINDKKFIPRSTKNNEVELVGAYDWTSGFYPGSLWNLFKLTGDNKWKERAIKYTEKLDTIQYWKGNHDVGFMIECSYGSALKNIHSKPYDSIIVQTAKSLISRFVPKAGILQSWNKTKKWECPVIIDNMMNLELLFHATKISGDSVYYNTAITHANTTLKNHFREDNSSYHVVEYSKSTGEVVKKNTHQGYSDESAWARGQAWGLYGYTLSYRETKDKNYLDQAIKIAKFIMDNDNLPEDKIPYWDYNVPNPSSETPRDASAAAITASALYELQFYVDTDQSKTYISFANDIMNSLSSPSYFAQGGTNQGFLLKHSVGSMPHNSEIDVPLNYADYYFLEALIRKNNLNKK